MKIRSMLITLGLLALSSGLQAEECNKTVRWNDDAPYAMRKADGEIGGFSIDLVRTVLQRMGCKITLVEMPWGRALAELKAGRLDILSGALRTPEREQFALFSRPFNHSPNVLFVAKNHLDQWQLKSLADILKIDFTLGTQVGVSYGEEFNRLSKDPAFAQRLNPIYSRRNAWKMLHVGRISGLIADEVTALMELHALGLDKDIVKTDVVVSDEPASIAFSKRTTDEHFVQSFNKELETMLANGDYALIRSQYIPCKTSARTLSCQ